MYFLWNSREGKSNTIETDFCLTVFQRKRKYNDIEIKLKTEEKKIVSDCRLIFLGRVEKCHFSGFDLIFSFLIESLLLSWSAASGADLTPTPAEPELVLDTRCNVENLWELWDILTVPCWFKLFPKRISWDFTSFSEGFAVPVEPPLCLLSTAPAN